MKLVHFNKRFWSININGTDESIQLYLRWRRDDLPDNECGTGINFLPKNWKLSHHHAMCRITISLWLFSLWFDYPYPAKKDLRCLRCNKLNPDLLEACWVGEKLLTQNPTPHIFENFK